jgi:hypothetical protein
MSENVPIVGGIERMETLTSPSITAVRTTFGALERTVGGVSADCRTITETLAALGDALQMITQGAGVNQDWGGFGMLGLPIMAAIRAVKGAAGQYVKQQTGVPLAAWTDLVTSSSAQFEAYLSQLDTVARLAERHRAPPAHEVDLEQARQDQQVLLDVRWQTQAWKHILGRVAQLGQLVDAILQVNLSGEPGPPEAAGPDRPSGFGSLQRRIKEVQTRTTEKSGDLGEWVLRPFVEIRDRVKQLPRQTEQLAHEVALLEILLELEIAEIRACSGEISPTEARIVGLRVATCVILPELAQRLADARQRALEYQAYLDRLNSARNAGDVDDRAYSILAEEYWDALEGTRSRLLALEAQADVWRRDGPAVFDACADWMRLELDLLAARRLVEQKETAADRSVLLQRERDRLDEARSILASL